MTAARELASRVTATSAAIRPVSPAQPMVKYTLLMTGEDADALDHLLLRVRRTHRRRVTKSQLIRSLIRMSVADASVLAQALSED